MKLSEFDYVLPKALIAQHPLAERDASRLLLLDRARHGWEDRSFRELPEVLRGDELLVVNNARVIAARLIGRRAGVRAERPGRQSRARREFLTSDECSLNTKPFDLLCSLYLWCKCLCDFSRPCVMAHRSSFL